MEEMKAGRELDELVIKALGFKKNQSSFEQYEPSTNPSKTMTRQS